LGDDNGAGLNGLWSVNLNIKEDTMITRSQHLMALTILILSASGMAWGAKRKNPPSHPAPKSAARNRVIERLQNASGPVRLVLRDHTVVKGRVVKAGSDHLTLQTLEGNEIVERTINFDDVKKITYVLQGHPYIQLVAGNAVTSAIIALIILAAVGAL
jgi:hypothetical protein